MNNFSVLILASGNEDGMKSSLPVAFHKICFRELITYAVNCAVKSEAVQVAVVTDAEDKLNALVSDEIKVINASENTDEIIACKSAMSEMTGENVVVMYGNMPLVQSETVLGAVEMHINSGNDTTCIKDSNDKTGICVFKADVLNSLLSTADNCSKLSDLAVKCDKNGAYVAGDDELLKITNRLELSFAEKIMQKRVNEYHMLNGVTIHSPETVFISPDVIIGNDTEIYSDVIIEAGSKIGSGVVITSTSKISNAVIGDEVSVQSSVILESSIGANSTVGPFAYVRPNCVVGKKTRIGDFVELKNCNIGDGTKVSHLTYVGDSDVGEKCNFGCGTVTVNYDGKNKYRTVIGNNVFIGCNSNLVAPVTLKDGAYTAAGSTITDEVPENQLAIARARQINKEIWKDRRKK